MAITLVPDTQRVVGEERQRFEALYRAHAPAVLAYARRRAEPAAADDVVADVFLAAWRRLDELPPEPRLWLLGAARKVLANQRRSQSRRDALRDRLVHQRGPSVAAPADAPAVDGAVLEGLAALSERDREALLLVAWDGLSPAQAAEVVGVRTASFTMRLSRARKRLAAQLEAQDEANGPAALPSRPTSVEVSDG